MAGKKAAKKAAKSKAKSEGKDSSESKEPKLKSLRTEGAASNTYASNENLSTVEGSAEQCLAQPKWAHQLLLLENKLAALREQLSREKPPDHIASFVAKNIADSLSNLEFPISDKKIAEILFKDFGQKPLQSLFDSLRLSRFSDRSAITAAVGLELAKLCGLNERSKIRIDNRLTFVPLNNASDGPNPFIMALLAGRIDVAKLIIEEDAPNSTKNWDGMTVYCRTDGRVSASRTSVYKISPLQLISALGEPEALRYLLSRDILAKQKNHDNQWAPLHYAAFFDNVDNMKVLIDEGKYDVNEKTSDGFSPLHLTLLSEKEWLSFDAFSLLMERGADVNEPGGKGVTPFHLAAEKDDTRFMEALLARDADVKKLDNNKRSPLHLEAEKGNVKAVEARDDNRCTPLHIAIRYGRTHIVKLLLAKGVIGSTDSFLVNAAERNDVEVIEALIAAGASPCTEHETPPWVVAANYDNEEAFAILLAHHIASIPDVQAFLAKDYSQDPYRPGIPMQGNAFHWACRMGDVKSATLFIEKGANVNDTNCTRGRIPLHFAAEGNHAALIKLLISHGANIQAKDSYGWSPLHSAAVYGKEKATAALVELNADLSVKTNSGKTPLVSYETYFPYTKKNKIISLLTGKR